MEIIDELLVKSQFVQSVHGSGRLLGWPSLFGYPKVISTDTFQFLESFSEKGTIRSRLGDDVTEANLLAVRELQNGFFLVSAGFDERNHLRQAQEGRSTAVCDGSLIEYLGLIMSEACNFRCSYCIHFTNLGTSHRIGNANKNMGFGVAKAAVDRYIQILHEHGKTVAEINFGGGEPLLVWPVVQKILDYCRATYAANLELRFSINTNASLMSREIALALRQYQVRIASSLDGLRRGNDKVRRTRDGGNTYAQVVGGFDILAEAGYPIDGVAMTITGDNFHELDSSIVDWAKARRMKDIRIDIDVVGMVDISIDAIVAKLTSIRRYAKSLSIDVHGFWSRPTEIMNDSPLEKGLAFCGAARGNSMCVNPSGEIYACGYSTTLLGNIRDAQPFYGKGLAYSRLVINRFPGTNETCRGCIIEGHCGGGCHISQEFAAVRGKNGGVPVCELYRRMTLEILREKMNEMTV